MFNAGEAILHVQVDSLNNELAYLLTTTIKTNSFLSNFYKINDVIKSWLSPKNLSLIKIIQSIRQGSYKKDHQAYIVADSIAISSNKTIKMSEKVYDPIAFIYFLRLQTLAIGNKYNFLSYGVNEFSSF